jgi:hypothetical protein
MIKASLGKLRIDFNPVATAKASGFELLNFNAESASLLLVGSPIISRLRMTASCVFVSAKKTG